MSDTKDLAGEAAEKCLRFIEDSDYTTADEGRGGLEAIISEVIAPLEAELSEVQAFHLEAQRQSQLGWAKVKELDAELARIRQELIDEKVNCPWKRKLAEHVEAERELLEVIDVSMPDTRAAAERLHKLREGIPQPQRLTREQLIEKAREAVIEADYDVTICNIDWRKIFKLMADFALSLDVNLREELRIANANLRGAWAKCAELARGKATVEVGFGKTTGTESSVTEISLEDVTPSGDGQKEEK